MADERRGRPAFSSKEYSSDPASLTGQLYPAENAIIWIGLYLSPILIGLISIWLIWELLEHFNFFIIPGV